MSSLALAILVIVASAFPAVGGEDALAALPPTPRSHWRDVPDSMPELPFGRGVRIIPGARVVLEGSVLRDQGPSGHGLEGFACLDGGRLHECMLRLDADDAVLVKAAFLAAFGLSDGEVAQEGCGLPARGTPLRVVLEVREEDGSWRFMDASCLIRDRLTDRALPPLPFVYTGSVLAHVAGPQGGERDVLLLGVGRTVVAVYDDESALLASPIPQSETDAMRFEVASTWAPYPDARIRLVFLPARLPLILRGLPDGALASAGGIVLDDAALAAAIAGAFAVPDGLQAIGIVVAEGAPRTHDVRQRQRLLGVAAAASCWAVPVFLGRDAAGHLAAAER